MTSVVRTRRTARLGDFVRVRTGKLDANASSDDGEYPFFTCSEEPLRIASFSYDCECVLVAGNGDLNVKYYNGKFDAYQRTYIVESTDSQILDVRYLFHFMSVYVEQLRTMSVGGVIKYIKLGYLTDAKIPLPPLAEQRRIAEVLDRAEALRAKRRAALTQLDSLTQSFFLDLFGDPDNNSKGLSVEPLGEHLRFVTSGGRGWAKFYAPTGSRFIRSLDVQMNCIGSDDIAFVRAPDNAEARRTQVKAGDVLLTITGSRIGRVASVPAKLECSYISQHVAILRVDSKRIEPDYLSFFLSLDAGGQRQIAKFQYGQTKPGLNFEQIRRFQVPVPPIELQNEFARRVGAVEKLKTAQRASLAELDALFASLQHRAFRGEL